MKQLLRKQLLLLAMVCATTAYAQTPYEYYDRIPQIIDGKPVYDEGSQDAWVTTIDNKEWTVDALDGNEVTFNDDGTIRFGRQAAGTWGSMTSPNFDTDSPLILDVDLAQLQHGTKKNHMNISFVMTYDDINGVTHTYNAEAEFNFALSAPYIVNQQNVTIDVLGAMHYTITLIMPTDFYSHGHTQMNFYAEGGLTLGASSNGTNKIDVYSENLVLRDDWDNTERLTRNAGKQLKKVTVVRSYTKGWYTLSLPFDLTMKQFQRRYMAGFDKAQADSYTWKETTCAEIWHYDSFDEGSEVMHFRKHDANDPSLVLEAGVPYLIYVPGNIESTLVDFTGTAGQDHQDGEIHEGDKLMVFTNIVLQNPAASVSKVTKGSASFTSNLGATDIAGVIGSNYVYYLHTDAEGENPEFYAPGGTGENATKIKGFRAYVSSPKASGAKKSLRFSDDNVVTSIDKVDAQPEKNMPIINLQGQHMNGDLKGLPRGIYIMNGKKYVVK